MSSAGAVLKRICNATTFIAGCKGNYNADYMSPGTDHHWHASFLNGRITCGPMPCYGARSRTSPPPPRAALVPCCPVRLNQMLCRNLYELSLVLPVVGCLSLQWSGVDAFCCGIVITLDVLRLTIPTVKRVATEEFSNQSQAQTHKIPAESVAHVKAHAGAFALEGDWVTPPTA